MVSTKTNETHYLLGRISATLEVDPQLGPFLERIEVTLEGSRIVVRGELPSSSLRHAILPAIRRAGVLSQVCNCVVLSESESSAS